MVSLGSYNEPDTSEIIENTRDDTLYKNDGGEGSYFSVQSEVGEYEEIQISPRIKLKVSIFYIKRKKEVGTLNFERIKKIAGGKWEVQDKLSLGVKGVVVLKDILTLFSTLDFGSISDRRLSLGNGLEGVEIDENTAKQLRLLFSKDEGVNLIQEIIDTENISKGDIVGVGYKKDQLEIFRKLLDDPSFYEAYKIANSPSSDEGVWQYFFEINKWIFGYGLDYVWLDKVGEGKIEKVIAGHDFNSAGKRIDGLLSTVSEIKKFVLVEIKRHNIDLLQSGEYRPEVYVPSKDLYGGIAQIQKSINKFKEKYFEKVELNDSDGNPIEHIFNISPKSFLIIGTLDEFKNTVGVNKGKYSSFELYRTNINGIEVITYDELYERARYIIESIQFNSLSNKKAS